MMAHQGGSIKFDSAVPLEKLEMVMTGLKKRFLGTWVDLHVRRSGDDGTHYLAYRYDLGTLDGELHKQFHDDLIKFVKDLLGTDSKNRPDGVMGWSLSRVVASGV